MYSRLELILELILEIRISLKGSLLLIVFLFGVDTVPFYKHNEF